MEVKGLSEQKASAKKLYRSRREKVIAGVCGGVAEYFNIDPVWVRIGWVLSVFVKGLGLVAYLLCWVLIPERESALSSQEEASSDAGQAEAGGESAEGQGAASRSSGMQPRVVMGIVLIVLGCIFAVTAFVPFINDRVFWAFVCIALGLALLARR
jgi:phage shock protein C